MKKKIFTSCACLLIIIIFNFALPRLMPGDPVLMLVGMDENVVSEAQYQFYLEKTGADKPLLQQFWDYFYGICTGDLGYSYHRNAPITQLITQSLPATLQISIPSILLSSILALVLGSYMGLHKGKPVENTVTMLQIIVDAVPSFLLALMLLAYFAFHLGWLPMGSLNSIRVPKGLFGALSDRLIHLILPVATLVLGSMPAKYLLVCNTVARQKEEKYVLYARSRGLTDTQLLFRHIIPNICQPFIAMVGMNVGFIVSGSLVIETIFSINGMGSLISQAISSRDYPVLQGCLFVSALVIVSANLLTDVICLMLDPKVRCKVHEIQ